MSNVGEVEKMASDDRRKRAIAWLADPPPGSRAAAAKEFGIDLTLLIENLKLSPTQRLQALQGAMRGIEQLRNARRPR